VISAASASATWATPAKNSWQSSALRSCARTSESPSKPREDHASYVGHWLSILREDKRAIFAAAAHAQRAVDYLHALQSERASATAQAAITSLGAP
jgi:antirestriction protein ArdC